MDFTRYIKELETKIPNIKTLLENLQEKLNSDVRFVTDNTIWPEEQEELNKIILFAFLDTMRVEKPISYFNDLLNAKLKSKETWKSINIKDSFYTYVNELLSNKSKSNVMRMPNIDFQREVYKTNFKNATGGFNSSSMKSYVPTKWISGINQITLQVLSTNKNTREFVEKSILKHFNDAGILILKSQGDKKDFCIFILSEPINNLFVLMNFSKFMCEKKDRNIILIDSISEDTSTYTSFITYAEKYSNKIYTSVNSVINEIALNYEELVKKVYTENPHLVRKEMIYAMIPPSSKTDNPDKDIYEFLYSNFSRNEKANTKEPISELDM